MKTMDHVKKRIIISMCAIVMLIITLVGITYAYFVSGVQTNTTDSSYLFDNADAISFKLNNINNIMKYPKKPINISNMEL